MGLSYFNENLVALTPAQRVDMTRVISMDHDDVERTTELFLETGSGTPLRVQVDLTLDEIEARCDEHFRELNGPEVVMYPTLGGACIRRGLAE